MAFGRNGKNSAAARVASGMKIGMGSETKARIVAGGSAPTPDVEEPKTFLDEGCELSGQLRFQDSVQIDGRVEGDIECAKTVVVGPGAKVHANISAESVVVSGSVEGDIQARRKITLHETAHLSGDLTTTGIVIEEGARFKGSIVIGGDDPAPVVIQPEPPVTEAADGDVTKAPAP